LQFASCGDARPTDFIIKRKDYREVWIHVALVHEHTGYFANMINTKAFGDALVNFT